MKIIIRPRVDVKCNHSVIYDADKIMCEISDLLESVCKGYNACVFAYGATGSGKTFTINELLPLICNVFDYKFGLSCFEIYNEKIVDLVNGGNTVTRLDVLDKDSCDTYFKLFSYNRHTCGTLLNTCSSRSHVVYTFYLENGKLDLIDLAGSERVKKSGVSGGSMVEAIEINKSLSALGHVVYALSTGARFVNYRSSVLTWYLRDSLNDKCCLIACYNGDKDTLLFCDRCVNIKLVQKKNKVAELEEQIRTLENEISVLKQKLEIVKFN